jgi:MraZ protein
MSAVSRYFTGQFEHTVDSVNRLVIPAKWRTGVSEELFVFAREEGRLAVLPKTEIDKISQEIQNASDLSPSAKRTEKQKIFSGAVQVTCDKQGRITMDARQLKHAGLKQAVILVGGGERFEMWNPKAWERRSAELDGGRLSTMDRFGI